MSISVILPVYNGYNFLEQSIVSVLNQNETGELIIIDDGSTDRSIDIISKYQKSDNRVKVITHDNHQNRGIAHSSNLGIEIAKCQYLTFLDQDDYFLENRFAKSIMILESNASIDGVYGKMQNFSLDPKNEIVSSHSILMNERSVGPNDLFLYLLQDFNPHFGHCSVLYRSGNVKNIKFDPNIIYGTDVDFLYQVSEVLSLVDEEDQPKIMRRVHDHNHSYSTSFLEYNPRLEMAKKWFEKIKEGKFPKQVNRALFYRLITRMYFSNYGDNLSIKRYPIKMYYIVKIILKHPWIIKRLISAKV